MIRGYRVWTAALALWLLHAPGLGAQGVPLPSGLPLAGRYPGGVVSQPDLSTQPPLPILETSEPANPDRPPDARDGVFQKLIFDSTWLARGWGNGFGLTELELKTVLGLPVPSRRWPLVVTPGFAVRYLDGPEASDLPPRLYDATVQFRWWRRLAPRLGIDLAVTPGLSGDFQKSNDEALRIPSHVVGVFDWTPRTKIVLGASYPDREDVDVLPVGGLIWNPNDDVAFELVVPRPKIARRIYWPGASTDDVQDWAYVAGEFGGGTWAIRRAAGTKDLLTYRDFRVILGLERKAIGRLDARLEVGYVFGREIEYASDTPDIEPSDTVMLRGGLTY
jgi:hypothetical protein